MRNEMSEKKEFVLPANNMLQIEQDGGNLFFESGGEFILPEYMPKVQKVLRMEARVLPPSRYMGSGEAQMSGSVLHSLLYIGEEGEISATVLPSKYEFSIPFPAGEELPLVSAAVEIDTLSYRLSAPRKLHIRTRLRAKPRAWHNMDITEKQMPAGEIAGLHKLCGELSSIRTQFLRSADISVSDTVEIGGDAGTRPIWCGSTAAISDVRATDGGLNVRGEVHAKVLLDDGGKAKMVTKKIPFEEFLDGDVQKGASATASAYILSTEAAKEQDGEALVDIVLVVEATVDTPCRIPVLQDAFSEKFEGAVAYRSLPATRLLSDRSGIYTVGGSITKASAGATGLSSVLDTSGEVTVEETTITGGKLTVSGRCACNTIYVSENQETASAEYSIPFKISLDCGEANAAKANVSAALAAVRARPDGDNLVCDMDIALCAHVTVCEEIPAVESMDFTAKATYKKSTYPLCLIYPHEDSLWSVAKKHHVSPALLAKINALPITEDAYASKKALADTKVLVLEL